jgi:ribonuclease P protein component
LATVSPAKRRLRKRREFLAVQGGGRKIGGKHFLVFVRPRSGTETSPLAADTRFGITVTRKIGNAVTRNRVKRVVREGFRQVAESFPSGFDLVIVARPSAPSAGSGEAAAELREVARRLRSRSSR